MELPTYTNIWKIEKRLYKLYDFRLPMPLPVGQVAAFLAIAAPYMLVLTMAGMPFSHTWVWLYVLPPGVLAWLVTRPVLEGKRLPELVLSQLRYLTEPRTWCRMAPVAEKDEILVSATVWRRSAHAVEVTVADADTAAGRSGTDAAADLEVSPPRRPAWPARPATGTPVRAVAPVAPLPRQPAESGPRQPERGLAGSPPRQQEHGRAGSAPRESAPREPVPRPADDGGSQPQWPRPRSPEPDGPGPRQPAARPSLTVRADTPSGPMNVVERALRTPRADGWHERVVVVPGGHRPGKPDQVQRDQARARLPLAGTARIVVLGCTGGAGQTVITLLTGQLLTSLRGEPVAVLDLGASPDSLTERAREIPRLLPARRGGSPAAGDGARHQPATSRERGLQVVTADSQAAQAEDAGRLIDAVVARYQLTLADPSPRHVPRALQVADQLILVAPASADAAGSLAMTLEWLEAHGHQSLARSAVTVLNGVSDQTGSHMEKAAAVASGRCRAIVRVPWDGALARPGPLAVPTVRAFTALAGVLIAGLAEPGGNDLANTRRAGPGQAER